MRSSPITPVVLGLAVTWLAGCTDAKRTPTPLEPDTVSTTPVEPNPLTVSVALDASRAVSARIAAEQGGTLTATSANGARLTLTIPAGALGRDETITLTPVASIGGLPLSGGLTAAAHFAPEGLRMLTPATLTIESSGTLNASELTGFAYHGTGAEFHLYPITASGSTATMPIMHFSGNGAGSATQADRAAQTNRPPTSAEDQAEQEAGLVVPLTSITREQAVRIYRTLYESYVKPRLARAEQLPDAFVDDAAATYAAWTYWLQYYEITDRLAQEIGAAKGSLERSLQRAFDNAFERCVQSDPYTVVEMLRWRGYVSRYELNAGLIVAMNAKLDRCARFELFFESTLTGRLDAPGLSDGIQTTARVRATVPIRLDLSSTGLGNVSARGPLEYVAFSHSGTVVYYTDTDGSPKFWCTYSSAGSPDGSEFRVLDARLQLAAGENSASNISLTINPGTPKEHIRTTCTNPDDDDERDSIEWLLLWTELHEDEFVVLGDEDGEYGANEGWLIRGWQRDNTGALATRAYARTKENKLGAITSQATETTVLRLRHTPQR